MISFAHSPEEDLKIAHQEVPVGADLSHHTREEHAQEEEGEDEGRHGHEHDPSLEQRERDVGGRNQNPDEAPEELSEQRKAVTAWGTRTEQAGWCGRGRGPSRPPAFLRPCPSPALCRRSRRLLPSVLLSAGLL